MNPFVIDAFEFCRLKERREGEIAVVNSPRLAEESVDAFGNIAWTLHGGSDKQGHPRLVLSISGAMRLICQRCLTPFDHGITSESTLLLAQNEASADELDALQEDEAVEVIVGSRAFNVIELVEDEVLLALPQSPKHEVCPSDFLSNSSEEVKKISPFAVLKNFKQ